MKHRLAAGILCGIVLLAACSTSTDPAPAEPVAAAASERARQTLWQVLDTKGAINRYLPDDHPDVQAVRKLITLHTDLVSNRDQDTIVDSVREERTFLAPAYARELDGQRYADKVVSLYRTNQLLTRSRELAWSPSTFSRDLTTARVEIGSSFAFAEASPGFLAAGQLELDRRYTEHRTISLAKTDGHWLITKIEKRPLTRAAAAPRSAP